LLEWNKQYDQLKNMQTAFTKLLGIHTPIVIPPMAGAGGGLLAAAAAKAGGFGFVAAGYTAVQTLSAQLKIARDELALSESSDAVLPVGVGFITWEQLSATRNPGSQTSHFPALDLCLDLHVNTFWFSFGNAQPLIDYVRSKCPTAKIFAQIRDVNEAIEDAQKWKADVIVAQGSESGGHGPALGSGMTTFTLVPQVVETFASLSINVPVLAAGGVSTGRQLAAARALGAAGVCVGTRMLVSPESSYNDKQKERLIQADGTDTVRTRVFDLMRKTDDWPPQFDGRALKNKTTEQDDDVIPPDRLQSLRDAYNKAVEERDAERIVTWSGQGIGLVKKIAPVQLIIREITEEALTTIKHLHESSM